MTVLSGSEQSLIQWGVVIVASLVAAVTDLGSRRIPNALTIPVLAGGLAWGLVTGGGLGLLGSIGACLLLAFPYVLLFVFAKGGAGDAKLMGAIGAWLGLAQGVVVLGSVAATGVVFAFAWAMARGRGKEVLGNLSIILMASMTAVMAKTGWDVACAPRPTDTDAVPYGVPIFIGVCAAAGGLLLWHGLA